MTGLASKRPKDIVASAVAEQERYAHQQRRARRLVKQAQRAVRDSRRLHQRHIERDARRALHSR